MAEPKTRPTKVDVKAFLDGVKDPVRRRDGHAVDRMMRRVSGHRPVMWGPNIVGYGSLDIVTADGRATAWPIIAFSPRSTSLVLYLEAAFPEREALLAKLGKHSTGKSCLYIKRLEDVDLATLEDLVKASIRRGTTPRRTARAKSGSRAARS